MELSRMSITDGASFVEIDTTDEFTDHGQDLIIADLLNAEDDNTSWREVNRLRPTEEKMWGSDNTSKKTSGRKDSVIIVTYNHEKYIKQCLDSVIANNPYEIIVVDNGSTDRTTDIVSSYSNVRLIISETNVGFGAANNLGASLAEGDNLVFLNPDTTVDGNWLRNLTESIKDDRTVCIPLILLYDSDNVNTVGNIEHISGLSFVNGLGKRHDSNEISSPNGVSGACFAMTRKGFTELGGFDKAFFCYMEDTELSWRMMVNGYKIMLRSDSIVHHDYRLRLSAEKMLLVETGRYIVIRKYMSIRAILATLPIFVIMEAITWGYCIIQGKRFARCKFQAMINGLRAEVVREKCAFSDLKDKLYWSIPDTPLVKSDVHRKLVKVANVLISLNKNLVVK